MARPFDAGDPTTWKDEKCAACGLQTRWRWCRSCHGDGFAGAKGDYWGECTACEGHGGFWHCKRCATEAAALRRKQNPTLPGFERLVSR